MRTIVVIDDNPLHRRLFADILEQYGYRVLLASEGAEGLALTRREMPNLVVIDCYLPGEPLLHTVRAALVGRNGAER